MKLAIMSDVHLEFGDMQVMNVDSCDVLVLAGDVLVAKTLQQTTAEPHTDAHKLRNRYVDFIKQCTKEFKHVVAIAGNHEFYGGGWHKTHATLREFYNAHGVQYLENNYVVVENQKFCGCTMWTSFRDGDPGVMLSVRWAINDFKKVVDDTNEYYSALRPDAVLKRHNESARWLHRNVDENSVVITHMAPSVLSVHERYRGDVFNHYYYTDMSTLIEQNKPKLWIHGHMHDSSDYQLYNTRVVCNPRGYVGYQPTEGYQYKVVEI